MFSNVISKIYVSCSSPKAMELHNPIGELLATNGYLNLNLKNQVFTCTSHILYA